MNNPKQLTFPWSKPNKSSFDHFYFDQKNLELKKNLLEGDDDLFLYGIKQSGKSFLLQAVCNLFASKNKSSLYVPISEVKKYGTNFIDSLDDLDVVCIDDGDLNTGMTRSTSWSHLVSPMLSPSEGPSILTSKSRTMSTTSFVSAGDMYDDVVDDLSLIHI